MKNAAKAILNLIFCLIVTVQTIYVPASFANDEEDNLDEAFAALAKSMKSKSKDPGQNSELDKKLEQALSNVLPAPVEASSVPIEQITAARSKDAVVQIAKTPTSGDMNIDYRHSGFALTSLLYKDSENHLKQVLTNMLRQLYSDRDATEFRILVNSSPLPDVVSRKVDLNDRLRRQVEEEEALERKRYQANSQGYKNNIPRQVEKRDVPVRDGIEIEISSGFLATTKNLDEIAARLALRLAEINPGVYGIQEDPRFVNERDTIDAINAIITASESKTAKQLVKTRDSIIAEFSAMERLAAAGFNPWALRDYERRQLSWMADVFENSANHKLGRKLLYSQGYTFKDMSRPLREMLQEKYMVHLQNEGRVTQKNLVYHELDKKMSSIRLRMKLYTKPFYFGTGINSAIVTTGAIGVTHLFFPEISHWALSAVSSTSPDVAQTLVTEKSQWLSGVGEWAHQAKDVVTEKILNTSFFGSESEETVVNVAEKGKSFAEFYDRYKVGLSVGGAAIGAAVLAKYRNSIGSVLTSIREARNNKKLKVTEVADDETQVKNALEDIEGGSEDEKKEREFEIKETRLLDRSASALASLYYTGKIGLQQKYHLTVINGRKFAVGTAQQFDEFAAAGKRITRKMGKGIVNKSEQTWDSLERIVKATPEFADKTWTASIKLGKDGAVGTYNIGKATAIGSYNLGKNIAIGSVKLGYRGVKAGAHGTQTFIFHSIPKATVASIDSGHKFIDHVGEVFENRKEDFKKSMDDRRKHAEALQLGTERRENILYGENVNVEELRKFMDEMASLITTGDATPKKEKREILHWGIESSKSLNKRLNSYFWQSVNRFNEIAKNKDVSSETLLSIANSIERVYLKKQKVIFDGSTEKIIHEFYSILKSSPHEAIQKIVTHSKEYEYHGLNFVRSVHMIQKSRKAIEKKQEQEVVDSVVKSEKWLQQQIAERNYKKMDSLVWQYLARPESSGEEIKEFFNALDAYHKDTSRFVDTKARSFQKIVLSLSPMEIVKIHTALRRDERFISIFGNHPTKPEIKPIEKVYHRLTADWVKTANSIVDLAKIIKSESDKYQVDPNIFKNYLQEKIVEKPSLISSFQDFEILFTEEFFWKLEGSQGTVSDLEKPLQLLLDRKRNEYGNNSIWSYDPIFSERVHRKIIERMKEIGQLPDDFEGMQKMWILLTMRGVSTVTDDMLSQLLAKGNKDQVQELENIAVKKGLVFDSNVNDKFALKQIKASPEYRNLIKNHQSMGKRERAEAIQALVELTQSYLKDLGNTYIEFLEEVSGDIRSTFDEAEIIDSYRKQKVAGLVNGVNSSEFDSRIETFQRIMPTIKSWSAKNQYEFLLYLRGDIPATTFIIKQFPVFGPERIRKIFQGLELDAAMKAVNLYLRETILARKDVDEGYGKRLTEFLISKSGDKDTKKYATLLLKGLLAGLEAAGNQPLQLQVLSAIVAMRSKTSKIFTNGPESENQANVGETIRVVLEQLPGVGPKIAQFMAGTRKLKKDINDELLKTQDTTLPPRRLTRYQDLADVVGRDKDIGVLLFELLGSGSIKYTSLAQDLVTKKLVTLQVFRRDVQNSSDLQVRVLHGMIDYLIKHGGREWGYLRVIVDGAVNAVNREKVFNREAQKTALARQRLYVGFNDDTFTVKVPQQVLNNERVLTSSYAKGVSFNKLSAEDKEAVGKKILAMESSILYANKSRAIWYDTDRHAGNYLIDVTMKNGKKHYTIWPIDFGQLTSITVRQRDRIADLFAMAGALGKLGSQEWISEYLAKEFKFNSTQQKRLHEYLNEIFPSPGLSTNQKESAGGVVADYYKLLSAINESLRDHKEGKLHADVELSKLDWDLRDGKLDFAYTDFVRAIIQLNQYEDQVSLDQKDPTPRAFLERQAKDRLALHLKNMEISKTLSAKIKIANVKSWIGSKLGNETFKPIEWRLTRDQLEEFSFLGKDRAASIPKEVQKASDLGGSSVNSCLKFYAAGVSRR
jgi:hypothetical protein